MNGIFGEITILEAIYWAAAIIGGTLFVLRLLAGLFGLGGEGGLDADGADGDMFSGDADFSFKAMSFQGVSAFFMMFGLSGLTLLSADLHWAWVVLGSVAVGGISLWIVGFIYKQFFKLQSDGTVRIENAVGQTGQVYLRIPAQGSGQVQVQVQERLRIFDAVSADKTPIATGEHVKVVAVLGPSTLVVEKV